MTRHGFAPFALDRNIPPGRNDPAIKPRVAILHVDAGDAFSLYDYFRYRSGGIESHFHIRKDGVIEQYRSIYYQADANRFANDFAVSIETQGRGPGEWNAAQLASIKQLLLWLRDEAGIPLKVVDRWNGSGVGYHTIFGAPSEWTPVAKSCPGEDRKVQFYKTLVPWMLSASSEPDDEEFTVAQFDAIMTEFARLNNRFDRNQAEHNALFQGSPIARQTANVARATLEEVRGVDLELDEIRESLAEATERVLAEGDAAGA